MKRTVIFFSFLAVALISGMPALIFWARTAAPQHQWLSLVMGVILSISILLTGMKIRGLRSEEQLKTYKEQLAAAELRFQAFFNDPAVAIGILSLERTLIDANPTFFRILGYERAELIGKSSAVITYPDDDPTSVKLFMELLAGQRNSYESDRRYIRKNGDIFWAHVTMTIVRGSDNQPRYLVGVLMDIDKQKRDALALIESEARFRAAFESSAIGMALTTLEGKFLKLNAAICKMSGFSEHELAHRTEFDFAYPDDIEVGREFLIEIMEGKRDSYQVERRFVRKSGEVFWARLTLSAVRNEQGQAIYYVTLVEDIDGQKKTLANLRKSEARFSAVFENAAVGISVINLDGKILAINPVIEQISGYSPAEIIQMNPIELMIDEDRMKDASLYQELIEGKRSSFVSEVRYHHKNGEIYWVRVNYSLVCDPDGKPDYMIALVENIDEEKRAAEKLAAQEAEYRRRLEQRIAERTEELNQANQLLQQKAAQEAVNNERTRLARDLHDAVTQTLFSANLIADVLPAIWEQNPSAGARRLSELRQMTRGALAEMRMLLVELRPNALTEIPLPNLIRQLCESVIGRDRLPIQINLEGQRKLPPLVQISLYRIAQEALNNIVKHAKATQAIVTLRIDEAVRLVVEDDGSGFDMSKVSPDHFGLKIMYERAEIIGAHISINSEPNEGTQVSVMWQENES